ncbi:1-phosphofructokinase [Alkalibacterium sp. MB6]|uniref:1-phosphofructokinase n=1 Tax=Alkalibacterium sp. MB6 TaxID=2081965 RepID=UPI00137B7254|nr:1-phosphofructokinase [Alkalibacterium sp. MB6]
MIYTVTLNPSIDYVIYPEQDIIPGKINRFETSHLFPGGKGINVSRILHELSIPSTATGFAGGFTGQFITDALSKEGILTDFVSVPDHTRINVKVKGQMETELNGAGSFISEEDAELFLNRFDDLGSTDIVILSGSKARNLPEDYYQQIITRLKTKGVPFVIDTTGAELIDALSSKPLVVKPNKEELEELYHVTLDKTDDLITYGKKLLSEGAQHVLISMAGDGALLLTDEGVYKGTVPKGEVKNSVGAGDSMVAGFVGQYSLTESPLDAFKMGLACGSATAFSEDLANKETIDRVAKTVTIEKLEGK